MEAKRIVQIYPNRLKLQETERNYWVMTCETGTTREDLKKSSFWSNVAKRLKPWDRIEVRIDDGTFFAEYLVLMSTKTSAKVHELNYYDLNEVELTGTDEDYEVKWKGPQLKHTVIRKRDSEVIQDGFASKEDAEQYKVNLMKSL